MTQERKIDKNIQQPFPFAPEQVVKTNHDLLVINNLHSLTSNILGKTVLTGGYAVDAHMGRVTRPHDDIDAKLYIPPQMTRDQFNLHIKRFLLLSPWNIASETLWETILTNPVTSQRIDLHMYPLSQSPENNRLSVRERATHYTYDIEFNEKSLPDFNGNSHRVFVEPVSTLVAFKLFYLNFLQQQIERRQLRDTDTDDLQKLLQHPDLDIYKTTTHLSWLLEKTRKYSKTSSLIIAQASVAAILQE